MEMVYQKDQNQKISPVIIPVSMSHQYKIKLNEIVAMPLLEHCKEHILYKMKDIR